MRRMARIHATAQTPGAIFEYDILDPNSAPGWILLHKVVEKPTVAGPDGKVPPPRTELVAGFPPSMTTFVEFYLEVLDVATA